MNRIKTRQLVLLTIGISLFGYLIAKVGWNEIWVELSKLRWRILPIIAVYFIVYILDTLGWRFGFGANVSHLKFRRLFWIRLAGEAVNNTTPTGYVGGEPVKAILLKKFGIEGPESLASLIVAKTTLTLSQIVFIFFGLAMAFFKLEISPAVRYGILLSLSVLTLLVLLFLFFQHRGLFSGVARILIRLKWAHKTILGKMDRIRQLEANLAQFYKRDKHRFLLSFFFHFLGWLAGVLEIYLILKFLGIPLNLTDSFIIEVLHQLIRGLAFMVPGNLGTQEAGNLFIFSLFGLGAALGISVSLIRRIRELFWAGIGWGILLINQNAK